MAYKLWNGIPLINDETGNDELFNQRDPDTNEVYSRGYVERDYNLYPETMFAPPSDIPLIPSGEFADRIKFLEETKQTLKHQYLGPSGDKPLFTNLNQNGQGYCWAYSTGHAVMFTRMRMGAPLVRINPHATACIIKRGRDEGGWCGLSAAFGEEHGYAEEGNGPGQWPLHGMSLGYDTTALREAMRKHKITSSYIDLTRPVWGRNLTQQQLITCLLLGMPCAVDFNWWRHSVCALVPVLVEAGSIGILIMNSWPKWGFHGLAVLQGSKAIPDGAICVRTTMAA